ncbi:MAG TPA: cupin domain-containing protein [Acidimicrobiales bacterium]
MPSPFRTPSAATGNPPWSPFVVRKDEIEAEIDRLAAEGEPGRRTSLIVHPQAPAHLPSLAPSVRVALNVALPGEATPVQRTNATSVGFVLQGEATVRCGDQTIVAARHDVWNVPSWRSTSVENRGTTPCVWLSYSNAPLLEALAVHVHQEPPDDDALIRSDVTPAPRADEGGNRTSPYGVFPLDGSEAHLMPYERLIAPPVVPSPALHWPWTDVAAHLDKLEALGAEYVGRRLYLLYNPATGRTNGTTTTFFATITRRPPGIVDRPHRHVSAAINYFFHGSGWSIIGGQRYEWAAGDLMLTAPGWMIHGHASNQGDHVYELTIQDQPLHIAIESLLWQEDLGRAPRVLGAEAGFATNREAVGTEGVS